LSEGRRRAFDAVEPASALPGAALGFHAAANGEMAASWPWSTLLARADEVIE